jgi:YVTN family beta-propeller protein
VGAFRPFIRSCLVLAALGSTSMPGRRAEAAPPPPRASPSPPPSSPLDGRLTRLTPRAWVWVSDEDRSANGTLLVGDKAALVVDPGLTPSHARRFLAAVRRATDRPVRWAVLTHWHPDHSLGAVCLDTPGLALVAHPHTRQNLAEQAAAVRDQLAEHARDAEERAGLVACRPRLPTETVAERQVFDLGGHTVEVFHPGTAHTQGDLVVWSPAERVLATGDLFLHDSAPSMGEGSVRTWIEALGRLLALEPRSVIPGHFAPGTAADLMRFRSYLQAQWQHAEAGLKAGRSVEDIARTARFPAFASFKEYPNYQATFADNARAVAGELGQPASSGTPRTAPAPAPGAESGPPGSGPRPAPDPGYETLAVLDVGKAPHQIVFSADGRRAFVAAAESDRIVEIDVATRTIEGSRPVTGTPLGVAVLPGDQGLAVSRFLGGRIARLPPRTGEVVPDPVDNRPTGEGPSLIVGPLPGAPGVPGGRFLIAVEGANRLRVLDPRGFRLVEEYPTGRRPFPPAFTSNGRKVFVPGYDDGTVTVVDLEKRRVEATIPVGKKPSGGAVLPGDAEYAVAVRGEDRVAFVSTTRHEVLGSLGEGIGKSPFSVVVAPDGLRALVNNTASHDVSVIDLRARRVVARIPVGEIPIVMAVHRAPSASPSSSGARDTLWVACEGSHRLHIVALPPVSGASAAPR